MQLNIETPYQLSVVIVIYRNTSQFAPIPKIANLKYTTYRGSKYL